MVREYRPDGYGPGEPMIPHGQSVIVTAPATFAFTYVTSPERHLRAAELLGASLQGATATGGRDLLPATLVDIIRDTGGPLGISALGYHETDIRALVEGTLKQQRLLAQAPRPCGPEEIEAVIRASMHL
jgi:alcohol dehydrogenase class IV